MKNVGIISAFIYTGISLTAAGLFLLATVSVRYIAVSRVERFGGAAWVFFLMMIITMPIVMPAVKKRMGRGG